jgi:hypothetical protein
VRLALVGTAAAIALALLAAAPAVTATPPAPTLGGCATFRAGAKHITIHSRALVTCAQARRVIRAWARHHFADTGPNAVIPWDCYHPARRHGECDAGLNGFIRFTIRP